MKILVAYASRHGAAGDFRDWPEIEAWAEGIARELQHMPVAAPAYA